MKPNSLGSARVSRAVPGVSPVTSASLSSGTARVSRAVPGVSPGTSPSPDPIARLTQQLHATQLRAAHLRAKIQSLIDANTDTKLEYLLDAAAERYGITTDAIWGRARHSELCAARFAIWYTLHHDCGWSIGRIARRWARDHGTICSGIRQHQNALDVHQDRRLLLGSARVPIFRGAQASSPAVSGVPPDTITTSKS